MAALHAGVVGEGDLHRLNGGFGRAGPFDRLARLQPTVLQPAHLCTGKVIKRFVHQRDEIGHEVPVVPGAVRARGPHDDQPAVGAERALHDQRVARGRRKHDLSVGVGGCKRPPPSDGGAGQGITVRPRCATVGLFASFTWMPAGFPSGAALISLIAAPKNPTLGKSFSSKVRWSWRRG